MYIKKNTEKMENLKQRSREMEAVQEEFNKLKKLKIIEIQNSCEHSFIREDNGDCHKSGYYYTCSKCNYWTNIRQKYYKDI
jgi:hypothetical protein